MGIGFVLLIWGIVGTILAGVGAAVLGGSTAFLTQNVNHGRRRAILAASLFPFVCFGWATAIFAFQAIVNGVVLHRDPGIGDGWDCPLPNGYALSMIDVTDQGWVYNPKTQVGGNVHEQADAVGGVRVLQVAGRYILGGSNSKSLEHFGRASDRVDSYFLLDTQVGKHTDFSDYNLLVSAAQPLGIQLHLEPIAAIYRRYRFTWFDIFAAFLFCGPLLFAAFLLLRWIIRLRKTTTAVLT
jgi:hypothetical protein